MLKYNQKKGCVGLTDCKEVSYEGYRPLVLREIEGVQMVQSIAAGIISGLISSCFLYVVMFQIKPKFKISEQICRGKDDKIYRIKIVNLTHVNLIDVKYTLHAYYRSADGIADVEEVPPRKTPLEFVQAYSKGDPVCDYAVRISYDLDNFINKDEYDFFVFTFSAKHALSGTVSFVRKEFRKEDIVCGRFQTGDSTLILLERCHAQSYVNCASRC